MKHPLKNQRWSEKQIRTLLITQEKSGLPIALFCKTHKIQRATFYNWRNKYGIQSQTNTQFIPMELRQTESVPVLFGEIELPSNVTVRLYRQVDASWIKSLLP